MVCKVLPQRTGLKSFINLKLIALSCKGGKNMDFSVVTQFPNRNKNNLMKFSYQNNLSYSKQKCKKIKLQNELLHQGLTLWRVLKLTFHLLQNLKKERKKEK